MSTDGSSLLTENPHGLRLHTRHFPGDGSSGHGVVSQVFSSVWGGTVLLH